MSDGGKSLRTRGATLHNIAPSAHFLYSPLVGGSGRNERNIMMDHANEWMNWRCVTLLRPRIRIARVFTDET